MATVNLAASPREGTGKGVARKLRAQERIPAIIYGYGTTDPVACSIGAADLRKALNTGSGSNAVLKLDFEGEPEPKVTIIKEIQRHPVSRSIIHLDLLAIDLNAPVEVSVPIAPQGVPAGVKLEGGVLSWGRRDINIRVLPTAIPESIELDISRLHINDAIHIEDLQPEGYEILDEGRLTICSVSSTSLEMPEEGAEDEEAAAEGDAEASAEESEDASAEDDS